MIPKESVFLFFSTGKSGTINPKILTKSSKIIGSVKIRIGQTGQKSTIENRPGKMFSETALV
jgi:hypothetical protein